MVNGEWSMVNVESFLFPPLLGRGYEFSFQLPRPLGRGYKSLFQLPRPSGRGYEIKI
jgi:hypothetical protein